MFGIGSKISTKIDHVETFRKAIDAAISAADRGVSTRDIVSYLRSRATAIEDQAYRGPYVPPKHYDGHGRPIEAKVAAAQRERQRRLDEACEIPRGQRQSAASGYRAP